MKGYRTFIWVFAAVFTLYVVAEINKPKKVDWTVTLSKDDKMPFGGYIIKTQLQQIFPSASIQSFRSPIYNQVNNYAEHGNAYIILTSQFEPSTADKQELDHFVEIGNYAFIAANSFSKRFLDSLKLETKSRFTELTEDSTTVNFVNPQLRSKSNYGFLRATIDQYFSKVDTARTTILGTDDLNKPNFIKITLGKGAYFIHVDPVCFSNYFMLYNHNADYAAKALSYLPADVKKIYWDEYTKLGRIGAATPLRVFLQNEYLRWALRIALIGMAIYVLFQIKRKQRTIPVIEPLKNTSLDFIKTVASVYFNQKNNKAIANQKITYYLEFIRQRFHLPTNVLDEQFTGQLSRKSGVASEEISDILLLVNNISVANTISDQQLLTISNKIDNFYNQV